MSKKKIRDYCCICGQHTIMSEEHIPPKKAYNDKTIVAYDIEYSFVRIPSKKRIKNKKRHIRQGGIKYPSLCEQCNNSTGSWYASEYIKWAVIASSVTQDMIRADLKQATAFLKNVKPLHFLKQVITCFLSINGFQSEDIYRQSHPNLASFVLDKNSTELSDKYRFFIVLYPMRPNVILRQNPIAMKMEVRSDLKVLNSSTFSELAHPPLALTMTSDGSYVHGATEITNYKSYTYNQEVERLPISLQLVDSTTPLPGLY